MERTTLGKKLQLNRQKVMVISDDLLGRVTGGIDNQDPGAHLPTYDPGSCIGNSKLYACDTNATCSPTYCITCATVCTCLGGCN